MWQLLWVVFPPNSAGSNLACQQSSNASILYSEKALCVPASAPPELQDQEVLNIPPLAGEFYLHRLQPCRPQVIRSSLELARVSPGNAASDASFELEFVTFQNGRKTGFAFTLEKCLLTLGT